MLGIEAKHVINQSRDVPTCYESKQAYYQSESIGHSMLGIKANHVICIIPIFTTCYESKQNMLSM